MWLRRLVLSLLSLFRGLALNRFVTAHPPAPQVRPAPPDLVAAYEGLLPDSLLELWRRKGLGPYGAYQITLIDPRPWQAVLDRWVVSAPDGVRRIPIALTPFGVLLYYRKLTATDEDVCSIDPVTKETADLAWSLERFFNGLLCDLPSLDSLISPEQLKIALQECGPLAPGEVYEVNQTLYAMQMLKIEKADALEMHTRLRDAVDPAPQAQAPTAETLLDAVPEAHRATFADAPPGEGLCGLYLSAYIDWYRLLSLRPDGRYDLLFWRIHHKTRARMEVRAYSGTYATARSPQGDETLALEIALRGGSLGSDANDADLVALRTGGTTLLLRADELKSIATAIGGRDLLGSSDGYFFAVSLTDPLPKEPSGGRAAPPLADLPPVLRALVHVEPLMTTITHVAETDPDSEDDGEGTVMCTLDLGTADGLRKNMPLYSPAETGRDLIGWVWEMDPHACQAGIRYQRAPDGTIAHGPQVGDVLTSRAPGRGGGT